MFVLLFQSDDVGVFGCLKISSEAAAVVANCSVQVLQGASILLFAFFMHRQSLKVALGLSLQNFLLQVLALDQEQKAKSDSLDG